MDLRIVLAGRVGLEVGGEAVPDPGLGSLGRLTLAFLVVERHRPVSCDELASTGRRRWPVGPSTRRCRWPRRRSRDQARVLLHQATPAGGPPDAVLVEWVEGVSTLAVDRGHVEVGARLLGAAAELRSSIGVPIPVAERAGHDDHLTRARRVLGQHAWAAATAAGRSMALEEMLGCSRAQVAP